MGFLLGLTSCVRILLLLLLFIYRAPLQFNAQGANVSQLMGKVEGLNQTNAKAEYVPPSTWVKHRTMPWDPKEYLQKSGIASLET